MAYDDSRSYAHAESYNSANGVENRRYEQWLDSNSGWTHLVQVRPRYHLVLLIRIGSRIDRNEKGWLVERER